MGFFSDLKEDLSQAVNELIPEEEEKTLQMETLEKERKAAEPVRDAQLYKAQEAETAQETEKPLPKEQEQPQEEAFAGTSEVKGGEKEDMENDMAGTLESLLEQIDMQEQPAAEEVKPAPAPSPVTQAFLNPSRKNSDEVAVITAGMRVKGDMTSDGSLNVIGAIEGNIDILGKLNITGAIEGNSKATEIYAENAKITGEVRSEGSVKIGQSSVIIGNIFANSAVIAGAVKGDIDVHGPVILDTSAIVMGNIKSKSVQINNGAVIEGMCSQCYADVNPTSFFEDFKKKK